MGERIHCPDANFVRARRILLRRGVTDADLAAAVESSRPYVCRCLAGYQRSGRVWRLIRRHLKAAGHGDVVSLLDGVTEKKRKDR